VPDKLFAVTRQIRSLNSYVICDCRITGRITELMKLPSAVNASYGAVSGASTIRPVELIGSAVADHPWRAPANQTGRQLPHMSFI